MQDNSRSTFDDRGALSVWFLLDREFCCGNGCSNCPYCPRHGGPDAVPRDDLQISPLGSLENPD